MIRPLYFLLAIAIAATCSAATETTKIYLHFDKDKSALTASAAGELAALIASLDLTSDHTIAIEGHTDSDGSVGYNEELALTRARVVRDYLLDHGVRAEIITTGAFGERDPLAPNRDMEGMALNRRVKVTVTMHSFSDVEELRRTLMEGSVQRFTIDPKKDNAIAGTAGVQIGFNANTLVGADGRPVTGEVTIELTEAIGLQAMLAHQLSTSSGDRMLETGGMLRVEAFGATGDTLLLAPGASMDVAVPSGRSGPGMDLFTSSNGADWTSTGRSTRYGVITAWTEPVMPFIPTRIPFKWPVYRESLKGKPIKPMEPVMPLEPAAPRRESYFNHEPWWAFLLPAKANARNEARYNAACQRHAGQLERYGTKVERFTSECEAYPAALERYTIRKAEWDRQKQAERESWRTEVMLPARDRYDSLMAPVQAKYDSLRAERARMRRESLRSWVIAADSTSNADLNGVNAYVFTTNALGWINCDRFNGTPGPRQEVIVRDEHQGEEQVFLVLTSIRSVLRMMGTGGPSYHSTPVPVNEACTLFAYTVIDGRAHVCVQPLEKGEEPQLRFRPSSVSEIGTLLSSMAGTGA